MEKFKITLSDGTEIKNLTLNGNNYVSKKKVTESTFAGKLDHVTIEREDGTATELNNAELIQIQEADEGYRFILREKDELTILLEQLRAKLAELGA